MHWETQGGGFGEVVVSHNDEGGLHGRGGLCLFPTAAVTN